MVVALITLDLRLEAHTLKEKRMLVKSLLSRMGHHNLSVYEAACQDAANRARLAAAWVGPDPDAARRLLERVATMAEMAGAEVVTQEIELY